MFQSSVRINVGPNLARAWPAPDGRRFQSSVRINVGPNVFILLTLWQFNVSILRED